MSKGLANELKEAAEAAFSDSTIQSDLKRLKEEGVLN